MSMATVNSFKAEVLGVGPSSERMGELYVVCVFYMQEMDLHYWWEHDNENFQELCGFPDCNSLLSFS